jgi:integrase
LLREPAAPTSRATVRARLLALQRFIHHMGPSLGRDPKSYLAALDARIPSRRSRGWHTAGTLVGGTDRRRRRRSPTLDGADLQRLVKAAGETGGTHAQRDRALVALHCFSGLRPEEIVQSHWDDFTIEVSAAGRYSIVVTVKRRGGSLDLLLPAPAADEVANLARSQAGVIESLSGPVFCARGARSHPLSYRAARDVLQRSCRRAGLPTIDAAALRAACAHWLRAQGLTDHEVGAVLGLARVRSVDQLLRHHAALDAQRAVREVLSR